MAIRDVAKERLANLKATGGIPKKAPPATQAPVMSQSAKNIKVRQKAEDMEEGIKRRKFSDL